MHNARVSFWCIITLVEEVFHFRKGKLLVYMQNINCNKFFLLLPKEYLSYIYTFALDEIFQPLNLWCTQVFANCVQNFIEVSWVELFKRIRSSFNLGIQILFHFINNVSLNVLNKISNCNIRNIRWIKPPFLHF